MTRTTLEPFDKSLRITERVVAHMRQRNVLVAAGVALASSGKVGDHIQISPPFVVSEAECAQIAGALDESLTAVAAEVRP